MVSTTDNIDKSKCIRILNGSEKIVFQSGEGFEVDSLPAGTRVIYPPPPLAGIEDVDGAIEQALENPLGCEPLSAQLQPGMKVTIVFDDLSLPLPQMQTPDLREQIITKVLEKLATASITDIHLIAALGLHRRMTPAELKRVLGKRIFNAFYPDKLYNYDAEDKENNVYLGQTDKGEDVEINRRVAESNLVIYVNINLVSMDGGNKSFATGVSTYRTIRCHHNHHTLMHSRSYMDPSKSALHASCDRMGKIIENQVKIFKIETTVNNNSTPGWLTFLRKPAWEFNQFDWVNFYANKLSTDLLPANVKREVFNRIYAPYGLTGVHAGRTDLVHEKTLENVFRQQLIPVQGQADILIAGLPFLGPYNVNSIMNPILVVCNSLGYLFNFYRGKPLVRKGGVCIFLYPLHEDFHPIHHPSYIEFYQRVLTDTTNPKTIEQKYEAEFAHNPKYIDLYRNSYAYHGVHPFYMWYWASYGMSYVGKVIFVKPKSKRPAEIMGFDTTESIAEALEMAKDVVGANSSITNYHAPPFSICDVA